jgi:hypothetical protein
MFQFGVAKELGMSLSQVRTSMTPEELIAWSAKTKKRQYNAPNAAVKPAAILCLEWRVT